jgi:FmdE, Molybdenum formylmethanofuran dehydrogenase operon
MFGRSWTLWEQIAPGQRRWTCGLLLLFGALTVTPPTHAETPEEWIALGARVHGAFGAFIPVGIRIGLDALQRLKAEPRGVTVMYYTGEKPPCPCIADGIMIATQASPGQGTLQIAPEKAPAGLMAVAIIRNKKTGEAIRYAITDAWLPKILGWNQQDPAGRYAAAMSADGLFDAAPVSIP